MMITASILINQKGVTMFDFNKTKKTILSVCMASCSMISLNSFALAEMNANSVYNFFNDNFSLNGSGALGTNYIWRGVSQTNDLPTTQAEVKVSSNTGLYLGTWASNVKFLDAQRRTATVELNVFGGYAAKYRDFKYFAEALHFQYPSTDKLNYIQYTAGLDYRNMVHASATYIPHVFHSSSRGVYYTTGVTLPLHDLNTPLFRDLSLTGDVGFFQFNEGPFARNDYFDYRIALNKKIKKFDLSLAWTDTDGKFKAGDLDNSKLVFSVGMTV